MDDNSIFGYTLIEFITALAMSFMLIYFLAPRYEAYTVEKRREAKQKTTSETAVLVNYHAPEGTWLPSNSSPD